MTRSAQGCLARRGPAFLGIRRAAFSAAQLRQTRAAIEAAGAACPAGVVMISVIRLSPDYPIEPGHEANLRELADAILAMDRVVRANATVLELGGIRASALRLASRATWMLAGCRGALGHFDRLTDAIEWIRPWAEMVGAPTDHASYVQLYRLASAELQAIDLGPQGASAR